LISQNIIGLTTLTPSSAAADIRLVIDNNINIEVETKKCSP